MIQATCHHFILKSTRTLEVPCTSGVLSVYPLQQYIAIISNNKSYVMSLIQRQQLTLQKQIVGSENVLAVQQNKENIFVVSGSKLIIYDNNLRQIAEYDGGINIVNTAIIGSTIFLQLKSKVVLALRKNRLNSEDFDLTQIYKLNQDNDYLDYSTMSILGTSELLPALIECHDKQQVTINYIQAVKYNSHDKSIHMLPFAVTYDYMKSILKLQDIIHFRDILINCPPIQQFCMACFQSTIFFAIAIFDYESNTSAVQIYEIDDNITTAVQQHEFEVWSKVKCILLQYSDEIIVTTITVENTVYIQHINSKLEYSFQAEFEIELAFETNQPQNLYVIDSTEKGHIICIPTLENQTFSHINATSDSFFSIFDNMLFVYSTHVNRTPLILPNGVDVDMKIGIPNLNKNKFNNSTNQLVEKSTRKNHQCKIDNNSSFSTLEYFVSHYECYEILVNDVMNRLETLILDLQHNHHFDKLSADDICQNADLIQKDQPIQIKEHQIGKAIQMKPNKLECRDSMVLLNRQETSDNVLQKQLTYNKLIDKLWNYDEQTILAHVVLQTAGFSQFETSKIFAFNMLSMFLQFAHISLNSDSQIVIYQLVSRVLPLFAMIFQQESQKFLDLRKIMSKIFKIDVNYDFSQFFLSTSCTTQVFTSKKASLLTSAYLVLLTLFSTFLMFGSFNDYVIHPQTFSVFEQSILHQLLIDHNLLCLHTLCEHMSWNNAYQKYASFSLLRLYQKYMIWSSESLLNYLQDVNIELQEIITTNCVGKQEQYSISAFIVVLEALAQPVYRKLIEIKDLALQLDPILQNSMDLLLSTYSQQQHIFDQLQQRSIKDVGGLSNQISMLLHSFSYNIFYLNSVSLYNNGQKDIIIEKSILLSPYTLEIVSKLLQFSILMDNDNQRMFMFEIISQLFLKSSPMELIRIISTLMVSHCSEICYVSINEFLAFLNENYRMYVDKVAIPLLKELLPATFNIIQTNHKKQAGVLIPALVKIIKSISRAADAVQLFKSQNQSVLVFYENKNQFIFNFQSLVLKSFSFQQNFSIDILKEVSISVAKQNSCNICRINNQKEILVAVSSSNKCIFISEDILFYNPKFIMIPIIYDSKNLFEIDGTDLSISSTGIYSEKEVTFVSVNALNQTLVIQLSAFQQNNPQEFAMYNKNIENLYKQTDYGTYECQNVGFRRIGVHKNIIVTIQVSQEVVTYKITWI